MPYHHGDGDPPNPMQAYRGSFPDGSIRFLPPYSKSSARYRLPHDGAFDDGHERCESCVHYVDGGGCHLVRGGIDASAYCERFYADYMVAGHEHENGNVEVNFEAFSDGEFDWEPDDLDDFADSLRASIGTRVRARTRTRSE